MTEVLNDRYRIYGRVPELPLSRLRRCFDDRELAAIEYAVLFGSRAMGEANTRSDYDIAVYGAEEFPWGIQSFVWNAVTHRCGLADCDLDVVDLRSADEVLLGSVAEAYVMLKGEKDGFSRLLAKLREGRRDGRGIVGGAGGG